MNAVFEGREFNDDEQWQIDAAITIVGAKTMLNMALMALHEFEVQSAREKFSADRAVLTSKLDSALYFTLDGMTAIRKAMT